MKAPFRLLEDQPADDVVEHGRWTMRGIERFERWPEQWLDFAQTWVLTPLDEV